jgi:hypothetical protein
MALHHKSPHSPSSIWRVPVGPAVTHLSHLQFIIKVSAIRPVGPDNLRVTCAYRPFSIRPVRPDDTFLHLHLICGTRRLACHVYLWDLSPSPSDMWDPSACVSLVDPSPSDLWDPTACVSLVPCVSLGFNKFSYSKNHETWESNPGPRARNWPSSPIGAVA